MPRPSDLISTIQYARKTYEAAVSVRAATIAAGDADMRDGMMREIDAQFRNLATALGYAVDRLDDDVAPVAIGGPASCGNPDASGWVDLRLDGRFIGAIYMGTPAENKRRADAIVAAVNGLPKAIAALQQIAAGDGTYGAQAREYKRIAVDALAELGIAPATMQSEAAE